MSFLKNLKIGPLKKERSTSVVLASDLEPIKIDDTVGKSLIVPFSITTPQATDAIDATNLRHVSVHITTAGTGSSIIFQTSNDGVSWVNNTLVIAAASTGTQIQQNSTTGGMFFGSVAGKYFRLSVTGITAGTAAGTIFLQETPPVPVVTNVGASQIGTYLTTTAGVSAAPSISQVSSSTSSVTLKTSNSNRKGLIIHNGATTALLVKFGATASATSFTVKVGVGERYTLPDLPIYTGVVDGIWEGSPTGAANVTEIA